MALRFVNNKLLNPNSTQAIRLTIRSIAKDVSIDSKPDHNPVEHKEVVYEDDNNPVKVIEKKTHTKQMWEKDDFRLARFVNKEKQINQQFAIDLISDVPPIECKDRVVSCDGGDGPLGHPRVFINLDQPGNHSCGYCGLRFTLKHHH